MFDIPSHPFGTTQRVAETLSDLRLQSQLLSELAQQQLATSQCDAALQTFAAIHDPHERRVALLVANFQFFPPEKIDPLLQILKAHPQTNTLAGRLALAMLETKNADSAWKLVETADHVVGQVFESEQQQYDFFEQALGQLHADDWAKITRFYRTFAPGTYQDWALLAMVKYLASQNRYEEAEKFADLIALPLRWSWTYWELSQLSSAERSALYFDKAIDIIETVEISSDEEEMMETLTAQLRIYGRIAFQKNRKDLGERLLERSEAAAASLSMPMLRSRTQCFLGKVLVELNLISSIRMYVATDTILESLRSNMDRSRVLVWLAEAGWSEGWTEAIEAISAPERGVPESERIQQIAAILRRFVAHHQNLQATGEPSEDVIRISGELFETRYFNPFTKADCGC